jgi:PucR family transcriptional regulator, purine catabolism regulatory protein
MLTLGDLLDHRPFGLELCVGGDAAREAPVLGAHSIDLPDPVRWLQERWVMLTTGVQLGGDDDDAQRQLVGELADAGMAALGLGLGIAHDRPPRSLVDEAGRRELPLVTVPLETPFREIVSFVARATASPDLGALRRVTAMEHVLLDALHESEPERAVVARLASVLDGAQAAYLDLAGRPVITTAPRVAWDAVTPSGDGAATAERDVGGRCALAVPVLRDAAPIGWVAVLLARGGPGRPVARSVARTAAELLALVAVTRDSAARERSARRRRLGLRVLRHAHGEADPGLAAELAGDGLDFTRPCHVVALAAMPAADPPASQRLDALEDALASAGDVVLAAGGAHVVALVQGDVERLEAALRARAQLAGLRAGVSNAISGPDGLGTGIGEARLALAVALGGEQQVRRHAGLDPAVALLGAAPPAARARLREALAALDPHPRLRAAVGAYLDAGLDLGRAARSLGLHRNSLRYRLDRAERLLGAGLRDVGTVTTLHLAVLAERLDGAWDPILAGNPRTTVREGHRTPERDPVS